LRGQNKTEFSMKRKGNGGVKDEVAVASGNTQTIKESKRDYKNRKPHTHTGAEGQNTMTHHKYTNHKNTRWDKNTKKNNLNNTIQKQKKKIKHSRRQHTQRYVISKTHVYGGGSRENTPNDKK